MNPPLFLGKRLVIFNICTIVAISRLHPPFNVYFIVRQKPSSFQTNHRIFHASTMPPAHKHITAAELSDLHFEVTHYMHGAHSNIAYLDVAVSMCIQHAHLCAK